jgi:hypothetical protein
MGRDVAWGVKREIANFYRPFPMMAFNQVWHPWEHVMLGPLQYITPLLGLRRCKTKHCLNPLGASRPTIPTILYLEAIESGNAKRAYKEDAGRARTDFGNEMWELD